MAMNFVKMKKYGAIFMLSFMPSFLALLLFLMDPGNLIYPAVAWVLGLVIGAIFHNRLTAHPFTDLIEGAGVLCLTFDSTGVIDPFILKVNPPELHNKKRKMRTLFDRNMFHYIKPPRHGTLFNAPDMQTLKDIVTNQMPELPKGLNSIPEKSKHFDDYVMRVPKERQNQITFAFKQFPCLIYNKNSGVFLTKEFLCKGEESAMMKHQILYLKRKTEELTTVMRDFARYVVELTRPSTPFFKNWVFWIAIVFFIIIVGFLLLKMSPTLMSSFTDTSNTLVKTRAGG